MPSMARFRMFNHAYPQSRPQGAHIEGRVAGRPIDRTSWGRGAPKEGDLSPSRGGVEARGHFLKVARPNPGPSRVPAKEDSTINNRT